MTIPTLVANYKEKVLLNQFRKVLSTLENAHSAARNKFGTTPLCYYGSGVESQYGDCAHYSELFLEELNIAHDCGEKAMQNKCIPEYKGWDEVEHDNNPDLDDDEIAVAMQGCASLSKASLKNYQAFILNDGTIIFPSTGSSTSRISINTIVDINGFNGPNKWGHDLFYFYTYYDGNKFIVTGFGVDRGCMPIEKGGLSTMNMINKLYK